MSSSSSPTQKASEAVKDVSAKLPSKDELKEDAEKAAKSTFGALRATVAGGVGGVCAVVVGHPFDLVKVRLQTAEPGTYKSAMDCLRQTIAREGLVRGLYRGVSVPLVGVTPMFAVSFLGYDVGKKIVAASAGTSENGPFSIAQISTAGLISGGFMLPVVVGMERVKIILQLQGQKELKPGEKARFGGATDVLKHIYRTEGIRGLFRGSAMTFARDGPGSAFYFGTYEYIKRKLTPQTTDGKPAQLSLPAVMAAGGAAGVAMWIPVFPVDTIKSRLQSAEGRPTIGGTIREIYSARGMKGFFPGFSPALARAVPANAATFVGVELAHQAMNKMFGE